ncbi:hypothetical protein NX794_28895 [Streptomyces sp. LP11]|uniref:Large membrane protein n=1 Tax=Streptomyces pyxinicus TaxID=2970331 RepID=A0ABT2B9K7_9ACTN|nr:hypothetical protein [Streptomyces sp. LP11]MCS0605199.1 hypothetical protein [Streptomyces sp. LP11]
MNTERPENSGEPEVPENSGDAGLSETNRKPEEAAADGDARSGRHRSPLVVASVAVAVLLVGGGGAYLAADGGADGRTGAGDSAGGDRTPPPLALDGWSGANGIAPGEPDPSGATYTARGELPAGPGSAPVYAPRGEVGEDAVARLAKAFGMDGAPVAEGRTWRVGGKDGTGATLQVNRDAQGSWTYSRYAPGTDNCEKGPLCAHDPMGPGGTAVSVSKATEAAAPVLKAAGLADAKTDASQVQGAQRVVNADPVVGGLPTYGWTTGLTVGEKGELVGGHGMLGAPVKGDTYPVVSAAKTLELLNGTAKDGHRMGIGGCASPVPAKDRLEQPCGASTGTPKRARGTVTVEKAVFGLAAHAVAGHPSLVPSWLFQVRAQDAGSAYTVTYPAVDPKYLPSSGGSGSSSLGPTATSGPREVRVTGYTADGRDLKVRFSGGVCADFTAAARESAGRVSVTVTEKPWPGKVCVMIAKEYEKTVRLDAPLDGRKVVGADGAAIPRAKAESAGPEAR